MKKAMLYLLNLINYLYIIAPLYILFLVALFNTVGFMGSDNSLFTRIVGVMAAIAIFVRIIVFWGLVKKEVWRNKALFTLFFVDILLAMMTIIEVEFELGGIIVISSLIFFVYDVFMMSISFPGPLLMIILNLIGMKRWSQDLRATKSI